MKPVLTPEEATELDRETQARGIAAEVLMERAGRAVARAAREVAGGAYGRRAVVVCGKGNNGGDGLVAARQLDRFGLRTTVVLLEDPEALREPAAANARRLAEVPGVRVRTFHERGLDRELARATSPWTRCSGRGSAGCRRTPGRPRSPRLNASLAPVVAVDIPSGVNGSTGAVDGEAVRAALTVTFGAAKLGAVLMPGAEHAGVVRVVDIGFPDEPGPGAGVAHGAVRRRVGWLPTRDADTHKRASGVLVVVAGSRGMTGAARLIATGGRSDRRRARHGGLRGGSIPPIQAGLTEPTFLPLPETAAGTVAADAAGPVAGAARGRGRARDRSRAHDRRGDGRRSSARSSVDRPCRSCSTPTA